MIRFRYVIPLLKFNFELQLNPPASHWQISRPSRKHSLSYGQVDCPRRQPTRSGAQYTEHGLNAARAALTVRRTLITTGLWARIRGALNWLVKGYCTVNTVRHQLGRGESRREAGIQLSKSCLWRTPNAHSCEVMSDYAITAHWPSHRQCLSSHPTTD